MKTKNDINELKNYIFDKQYLLEKTEETENLKQQIGKLTIQIEDAKKKQVENHNAENKLKILINKLNTLQDDIINLVSKRTNVEDIIDSIVPPYRNILYLKYICNYTFDQIAFKMNYSTKRIYQLHKAALEIYSKQEKTNCSSN